MQFLGSKKRLDLNKFKRLNFRFEQFCRKDIDELYLDKYLDGLMTSKIFSGNVMVRKMLSQKCPNLQRQIQNVFENARGNKYFWLNYTRIYYSSS
jgi:hypothetical protein